MTFKFKSLLLVVGLAFSAGLFAQSADPELRLNESFREAPKLQAVAGSGIALIEVGQTGLSGVQFELRYDKGVRVSSTENCLAGIPDSHKGAFTTCNHFPDRNTILVIVSDIGNSRELNGPIGWIEFDSKAGNGGFDISEVVALDTGGKSVGDVSSSISLTIE